MNACNKNHNFVQAMDFYKAKHMHDILYRGQ